MNKVVDLIKAHSEVEADIMAVEDWCTELYDNKFKHYFDGIRELHSRLENKDTPITDDELSYILVDVPLVLIDASEAVSSVRLEQETLKLRNKSDSKNLSSEDMLSRDVLLSAYTYVLGRVEREISFTRELIMGAKKIWDSRRRTDTANPVTPAQKLPEMGSQKLGDYYIK